MLLAIDARNREAVLGFREGDSWLLKSRVGVSRERSADEYALFIEAAMARLGSRAGMIDKVWLSSVVPALTPRLVEAVSVATGLGSRVVGPGTRTGLKLRTDFPQEVGADLVCAAVAARSLAARDGKARACIIVDSSVVLALSALNASGEFVGASIAPGLETAAEALEGVAAQIPGIRLEKPERAIGKSTKESVQSGVVLGYAGLVCRLVELMQAELGGDALVLGTGAAEAMAFLASCGIPRFVPDLALEGLAILADLER